MTVAFTGYRPEKMPFRAEVTNEDYLRFRERERLVIRDLIDKGYTHFISGMALGFDMWAAEDVLEFRKNDPRLTLESALPFPEQAGSWSKVEQERHAQILSQADRVTLVSTHYSRGCYFARNRYMVNCADAIVCAFDGKSGGTAYTVQYALERQKPVIQISPLTAEVTILNRRALGT